MALWRKLLTKCPWDPWKLRILHFQKFQEEKIHFRPRTEITDYWSLNSLIWPWVGVTSLDLPGPYCGNLVPQKDPFFLRILCLFGVYDPKQNWSWAFSSASYNSMAREGENGSYTHKSTAHHRKIWGRLLWKQHNDGETYALGIGGMGWSFLRHGTPPLFLPLYGLSRSVMIPAGLSAC